MSQKKYEKRVTERQASAILLRIFGASFTEIGEILGISRDAARQLILRGIRNGAADVRPYGKA